jgi:hypothetical protein
MADITKEQVERAKQYAEDKGKHLVWDGEEMEIAPSASYVQEMLIFVGRTQEEVEEWLQKVGY